MTERDAQGNLVRGAAPAPVTDAVYVPDPNGPREDAPPPQPNVEDGPPRVVIPHTARLRPAVRQLGEEAAAIFEDVSHADTAYFDLMQRLWAKGRGFLLLEHDVVPTAALLEEMWACPAEWCAGWFWVWGGTMFEGDTRPPYPWRHRVTDTLALSKFGSSLLRRAPGAMIDAAARTNGRRHFNGLDLALVHEGAVLQCHPYFAKPHLHGPVEHRTPPAWLPLISEWVDG